MKYLIMLSAILMATECLCFCFLVNSLPTMLVFAAFYGLGNGAFLGTGTNYIYELAPVELRATAHSLFISVAQISGILGNLLGGVLFDTIGGKAFYGVTAACFSFPLRSSPQAFSSTAIKKKRLRHDLQILCALKGSLRRAFCFV